MIRNTYRNIMLALLATCFGISFYLFRLSQDIQVEMTERENDITRLNQELENAQTLNVALTELDNLTITEQTATQLDILRHLGLEQTEIGFQMESREIQSVGGTSLYTHNVRLTGTQVYDQILALCDRLQNTKKIILTSVELTAPATQDGNKVTFSIAGKIYGLDKNLPTPSPTEVVAPATEISSTEPVSGTTVSTTVVSGTAVSGSVVGTSTTVSVSATAIPSPTTSTEAAK